MWPDRVSNPGPLTYESGAQPTGAARQTSTVTVAAGRIGKFLKKYIKLR